MRELKQIAGATLAAGVIAGSILVAPAPAEACGGFFCNGGGGGPTPVVQAAERVIFEKRQDGSIRAYVQIRYNQQGGAPVGFSWIIPVTSVPDVGIASAAMFDELDAATSPQFRFINNATPVATGGGGVGCGSADELATARGGEGAPTMDVDGVMVWETDRVGNYDTATISGERAEDLLQWLTLNEYDIPFEAGPIIQEYVDEGHLFVAFRYAPADSLGLGTLDPVVLTYFGDKPCVPIRITSIASMPILDIMILAFGAQRAAPTGTFMQTEPDWDAIRPDFSMANQTTYWVEVDRAVEAAGGRALIVEHAGASEALQGVSDLEARALMERSPYVTRFYTRITPEAMTFDPEFEFPGGADVARLHVIDITPRTAVVETSSPLRYAAVPAPIVAALALLVVRARRRR